MRQREREKEAGRKRGRDAESYVQKYEKLRLRNEVQRGKMRR